MKLDGFQRAAIATTAATILLVAIGGLVRATGSGLGCPDWPKCFDAWIPPTNVSQVPAHIDPAAFNFAKAWTEYINRLLGVLVGFLIFGTTVLAWMRHRKTARVWWPTFAALIGVGFEGWLGGQVVKAHLAPMVLTAHLVVALIIVGLLVYATVSAFYPEGRPLHAVTAPRKRLAIASAVVLFLLLLQTATGALVRGRIQLVDETLARSEWFSAAGGLGSLHANVAVLMATAVLVLTVLTLKEPPSEKYLRRAGVLAAVLVMFQGLGGWGLQNFEFPVVLQIFHLWSATSLLATVFALGLLALRLEPPNRA